MEKFIHYCWFGNAKMPKLAKKCIKSWKKYLPEYQIIEWNEKNFDVNITKFSQKAYEEKKWAFVSDVARIYALNKMGGIYFDTDMMIKKRPEEDILDRDFFVGWESNINIAVGVLGAKKGNNIVKKLFEKYKHIEFDVNDLYRNTIPRLLTDLLKKEYGMKNDFKHNQELKENTFILARDYFYPISSDRNLPNLFTDNTCMIHYYSGTWLSREEQIQAKFDQIFGRKLGKKLLKVLLKIKLLIKSLKRILKKILIIFLYPLVRIRRKRYKNYLINTKIDKIDKKLSKVEKQHIIFYHEDWLGIGNATKELFGKDAIGITEIYDEEVIEHCAKLIIEKNINFVGFSGFADGWDELAKRIKQLNNGIKIKVIWHGSVSMNIYDYDYYMFAKMFELLKCKQIDSIAFVKKSMYEFFKKKGYNVEFLANNITISDKEKEKKKTLSKDKIKIGIYASGDRWVKNFYNQMAAASLIENCVVDCIPINYKAYEIANIFNLEIKGLSTTLSHNKLLERMAQNDINLYVTFSECAPIIPLESLEMGVPCITGNNHHYFEDSKLEEYLVVQKADDVNAIYEGIKRCLENREEIMLEYSKWKEQNNIKSQKSLEEFLNI